MSRKSTFQLVESTTEGKIRVESRRVVTTLDESSQFGCIGQPSLFFLNLFFLSLSFLRCNDELTHVARVLREKIHMHTILKESTTNYISSLYRWKAE